MTKDIALHSEQARVGLVLSGGGASAAYQAGVVKALSELDVQVHAVAGASAGAFNGVVVSEANGDLKQAALTLEKIWTGFIGNGPIEWRLGRFILQASARMSEELAAAKASASDPRLRAALNVVVATLDLISDLEKSGLLPPLALADVKLLEEMLDRDIKRLPRGEGLPLYVSIFKSADMSEDIKAFAGKLLDLWDTPPSEFRLIQSLSPDEQKATIMASAAIPIVLQARRLGHDGQRYVDGVMGGYQTRQGNTPADPLVEQAGCTHLIVTHSEDGSPWRRDRFPDTAIIEVRPGRTMKRTEGFMGEARDMFNFSEDIRSWIGQGYEDAKRCVGDVKRSLDLTDKAAQAREQRDRAANALDEDSFRVD